MRVYGKSSSLVYVQGIHQDTSDFCLGSNIHYSASADRPKAEFFSGLQSTAHIFVEVEVEETSSRWSIEADGHTGQSSL